MKTAMQELFSRLEKEHPSLFNTHSVDGRDFINSYYWFLEMEKQQIIDAQSYAVSHADMTNNRGYFDCEQYYNETFKNE